MRKNKTHPLRWVLWSLAAAFYFYEFFIRVSPSVMINELMGAFNVDATVIGTLSAIYFYIYAPMQLVVGILTDRFGARKLLVIAALGAGIGTLLFSIATSFWMAAIGRFLMGAGSSFGFIGMIYICSHWFSIRRRGILIGVANGIGMLGAVFGEGPLRITIERFGWRPTMLFLALAGILLSALIFFLVRNEPAGFETHEDHSRPLWNNFKTVISNRHSWINAISSGCAYIVTPVFAGLWGIPFLAANYGISVAHAGFAVSMVFIGWAIGGPIVGRYSDLMRIKKPILIVCYFIAGILMSFLIFVHHIPILFLYLILFLVGFFTSAQLLNYSYSIDINPKDAKGTASAFTNFVIIAISSLAQPFVGFLLDLQWTGQLMNGVRVYPAEAYTWACATMPLAFFIAFFLSLFLKRVKIRSS